MNDEKYDYYKNVKSDVMDFLNENYDHALDVCVRCYVLGHVFWGVVKEFNEKFS